MSDPYQWPDLGPDPFGVADPTPEELEAEALAAEDDRLADADWGWEEPPC